MLPSVRATAATLTLLLAGAAELPAQSLDVAVDTVVRSEHTVTINGQRVPYRANAAISRYSTAKASRSHRSSTSIMNAATCVTARRGRS